MDEVASLHFCQQLRSRIGVNMQRTCDTLDRGSLASHFAVVDVLEDVLDEDSFGNLSRLPPAWDDTAIGPKQDRSEKSQQDGNEE
jgi:hypothetical protein